MTLLRSRLAVALALALATLSHAAAQENDPIGRFDIARFSVEGNSLLAPAVLDALLAPHAGMRRDFGDVQRALEALEAAYHQRGYKLVTVVLPEQELNEGVVRLQVLETRIGSVKVQGNRHFDTENVRRSLPALREGDAPLLDDISASLRLANENPAKQTRLQLRSGAREGEVNATLAVEDEKPWSVGLTLDNSGSKATGDHNIGLLYRHANVGGRDHVLSLQYQTTVEKPSRVAVYGVGYHIPLYTLGDSIDLYATHSDVDSGTVSAGILDLRISGKGTVLGARYNQTLLRTENHQSRLIYGIDHKAYRSDVRIQGFAAQLGSDVTVRPLSLMYAGTWTPRSTMLSYYVVGVHNLSGGENGGRADFAAARFNAPASWKALRYGASLSHAYASGWQVRLHVGGQYSPDALVPGEQFGAGGASVRAYNEREVSADSGYTGGVELYTPNLCASLSWENAQCRVLGFIEGARLSRNDPLPGEFSRASIGSIGLGWRLSLPRHLSLQLDLGHALASTGTTASGDNRLHFKMNLSY